MRAPESLRVAPIEEPDDGAVAALWDRCFGGGPVAGDVAAERTHRGAEAWLARDGAAVVGFAFLRVVVDEAEVHTVGVDPARRREGIGRALLTRAAAAARARGAARLYLEVARDNEGAIALYEAMGFGREGVRPGYYPGGVDALVMALHLTRGD